MVMHGKIDQREREWVSKEKVSEKVPLSTRQGRKKKKKDAMGDISILKCIECVA
jgi:hypothetical protein